MDDRIFYLTGLLGIIALTVTSTVTLALSEHIALAGDSLAWGATGAFLWGIFKNSGPEESEEG